MPPRTRPALVPRAHDTSILLYWRATSLLISAPLLRASLPSSGIRSRTSPLALRRRDWKSLERFLRKKFIVILDDEHRPSAHVLRDARLVSSQGGQPTAMPSADSRRDKDARTGKPRRRQRWSSRAQPGPTRGVTCCSSQRAASKV